MFTYEVCVPLATGHYLNVTVAETSIRYAIDAVMLTLEAVGVIDGKQFEAGEITATKVEVIEVSGDE